MIISRGIRFTTFLKWTGPTFLLLLLLMGGVATLYYYELIEFYIPWLPISIVGTAVAFYTGFKNNQAYSRMWEARKIWGGIINDSRSWGMMVDGYISKQFNESISDEEIKAIKKRLIYRHIGWTYAHRCQLLVPTPWEHSSQKGLTGRKARYFQNNYGIGLVDDELTNFELEIFLPDDERYALLHYKNTATQIINKQSRDLQELRDRDVIDDFRHVELVNVLKNFYTLQGKNERIKKFPLPRQYANMSRYFVAIFTFLLPFGMIPEVMKIGDWGVWASIPITALVAWVYMLMEKVGDYSENPFQGMSNDIPMLSLCRTIEIDLREMLGETELPGSIQPKKDILM